MGVCPDLALAAHQPIPSAPNSRNPSGSGKPLKPARGGQCPRETTLGLLECDITDEQQSLVARASSTCMTLRGEDARGR